MMMLSRKTVSAFISFLVFTTATTTNGSEISAEDQAFPLANTTRAIQSNIIGGGDVVPDKYPWFAQGLKADGSFHRCGGSLVTPEYVLTTAFCVGAEGYPIFSFKIGALSRDDSVQNSVPPITIETEKATVHPKYTYLDKGYDYALVKLKERVDAAIVPVKMAQGILYPRLPSGE